MGSHVATTRSDFVSRVRRALASGVPIQGALLGLTESPRWRRDAEAILASIDRGSTFAEAIAARPRLVSAEHAALIEAGERSGQLTEWLEVIERDIERTLVLRRTLFRLLAYPLGVLAFALIVPPLMYRGTVGRWPGYVSLTMPFGVAIAYLASAVVWAPRLLARLAPLRRAIESTIAAVPLIRTWAAEQALWRPLWIEGQLLRAGLGLDDSLEISLRSISSLRWQDAWKGLRSDIRAGLGIAAAAVRLRELGAEVPSILAAAADAGRLDEALTRLGDDLEARVRNRWDIAVRVFPIFVYLILIVVVLSMALDAIGGGGLGALGV
jgi:general secretion pathway protein F